MYYDQNCLNNLKNDDLIDLSNLKVKVYARYFKIKKNEIKKEWFLKNLFFLHNNKKYNLSEVIVFFNHIDEDNPEFFLQPEQIINIIKSKLLIQTKKNILFVDKFKHLNEEERSKEINSS
ncbi:MAG: hypothetical protein BGWL_c2270 [Candidatus Phytoplasma cynodontis]|nr:MAG: hypothetical protein BGWL_c2270 [Candidatus Phytoplasma cynodontis]